jgi:hypothetical protein
MWTLITHCYPPLPPRAGKISLASGGQVDSYGSRLMDVEWNRRYDSELRLMVARCMAHDPAERPSLRELLQNAEAGVQKDQGPDEDDTSIKQWVNDVMNSAPVS